MRERFLDLWPIWDWVDRCKSRFGFLSALAVQTALLLAPMYLITNHLMGGRGTTVWDPSTSLDLAIPFMAWTVIIYMSLYFLFYPLPLYSMPDTTQARREMKIGAQGLAMLCLISCAIFVILPAEVHIRSQAVESLAATPSIFQSSFEMMWQVDTPFNSWPSLHVSQAGLLTLLAMHWWRDRPVLRRAIIIAWVVMNFSILTTKQHFVWDLVTGLALLAVVWRYQVKPALSE